MGNPHLMYKSYGSDQLAEELTRILSIKSSSQLDVVERFSIVSEFRYNKEGLFLVLFSVVGDWRLTGSDEFQHVRVMELTLSSLQLCVE